MPDLSDALTAKLAQEASLAKEQWKVPRTTCPVCSGQPFQTGAHCRGCNGVGTVVDEAAFRELLAAAPEGEDPLVALTAELRKVRAERDKALATIAEYEGAICWDTTCLSCATVLDSLGRETERREQAEAAIGRVRALAQRAEGYGFDLVVGQIYDVLDGGTGLDGIETATFADLQSAQGATGRVNPADLAIKNLSDDERAAFLAESEASDGR